MKTVSWTVNTDRPHAVRAEHHAFRSGKVRLLVDDEEVFLRPRKLSDRGLEHRFEIDGQPCLLRISYFFWRYQYELYVDGKLQY